MSRVSEPHRGPTVSRRRRLGGRRRRPDRRGQSLTELVLVLPILLVLVFGILEVGRLLETQHTMSVLTREGANLASRGTSLEQTVTTTRDNQETSGLGSAGASIVSRVLVDDDGVPVVNRQLREGDLGFASRVGSTGEVAAPYQDNEPPLLEGQAYYVVEIFLPYQSFTPFGELIENLVPETLYDRSLF